MATEPVRIQLAFKFGDDFELDFRAYELRRAGQMVKLEPTPFELLVFLVEQRGNLVGRQQIAERIWGKGVFLDTDNSINGAIRKIRHVLDDDPENPRFIQTVTGKGYRFIAPIVESEQPRGAHILQLHPPQQAAAVPATVSRTNVKRMMALTAFLAIGSGIALWLVPALSRPKGTAVAPIRSIAVLPLDNLSGDPSQDYFADAMTDELITDLAKVGALRVTSRTTVTLYKHTRKSLPQIARELNVDGIVEGSVVRSGQRVRITAQLIRGSADQHLWAETDASGICSMLLPEKLVVVFTPNRQSIEGAVDLVEKAVDYRRRSDDLRPLMVLPLPSRIEPTMERLRRQWRFDDAIGYQVRFEKVFKAAYALPTCDLTAYFDEIQIQQVPDYAYGEEIAVLVESNASDRLSLTRSYESFALRLTSNAAPWQSTVPEFYSVFISYSAKDKDFAERLRIDLSEKGVRSWLAPQDIKGGEAFRERIDDAIKLSDRILLVLSRNSVASSWVQHEVEKAFEKERAESRISLLPVCLDDSAMSTDTPWVADIRKLRHIVDFTNWTDPSKYQVAMERLTRDLKAPKGNSDQFKYLA